MNYLLIGGLALLPLAIVLGFLLAWELLRQNGRMLLRLEALEKRVEEKSENGAQSEEIPPYRLMLVGQSVPTLPLSGEAKRLIAGGGWGQSALQPHAEETVPESGDARAERFSNRSLANSKIKRDGLKAGTVAPEFRLPRLNGGELALSDLRGKLVLLVFSSPHCGPCNVLAPKLQKFHRKHPDLELVMISQGEPAENREKVNEHGLTFPVVLQKQWEISRAYAFFATPVAYLIDGTGVIAADVAVGVDGVAALMRRARGILWQEANRGRALPLRRFVARYCRI